MYKNKYEEWLINVDEFTKRELRQLNDNEIKERFYTDIKFGTAGIRGLMETGPNRINKYVIKKVSSGLGNVIKSMYNKTIVIGYDNRHLSKEFAEIAALVFAEKGIKTYLFENVSPTPLVSYAIRKLGVQAGVMITASHNPKEYNGYKVYWEDGAQVSSEIAKIIEKEIDEVEIFKVETLESIDFGLDFCLIEYVPNEVVDSYVDSVLGLQLSTDVSKDIKVIYTPLGGVGNELVTRVLKEAGYSSIKTVESQSKPDPNFSNVKSPNPEDRVAFELAEWKGSITNADLLIATDPDVDRVGVMVKNEGQYKFVSGNMLTSLIVNYLLSRLSEDGELKEKDKIITTIVSDSLGEKIASKYGLKTIRTHVGFKNIYSIVESWKNDENLLVGYEESLGIGIGSEIARDKDAISASLIIVEMAAYYKKKGKDLIDVYNELEKKYGYHKEKLLSIKLSGIEGKKKIESVVEKFREESIAKFAGGNLKEKVDYLNDKTGLEKMNVIKYEYDNGLWFVIRPSGTEPKLKVYIYSSSKNERKSIINLSKASNSLKDKIEQIISVER